MDPSVLLKMQPRVQFPDPVETYKGFLSLRQMMDLGKLRQVQLQQEQLDNLKKQQDLEDDRRMREAFAGGIPDDTSLSSMLQRFGKRGIDVYSAMRQAQTAESTRQTAKLTQEAAARKAQTEHEQQVADVLYGIRNIQDPGQRQAAMDEATMQDLMRPEAQRLGLGKIGEVTPLAPNEQQFRAKYAAAYTPEKLQTLLNTETQAKEADLKTAQEQGKIAGATLGLVNDQESLTKWYGELPFFWRSRVGPPPKFDDATMQRLNNMFLTPEQRTTAQKSRWESPGGLISVLTDPNASQADRQRALVGLGHHEDLRAKGAINLSPNQTVQNESKLRDDYTRDTKNYVTIRDAFNKIQGAAKSATGAGDISLVYGYMKMMDPGSTVREGEFATAQNAGSIPQRVWAMYNKAVNGERLDPTVRQQFVAEASKVYAQSLADYQKTKEMYGGIATRSNLDPRNVVIDLSPATPKAAPASRSAAPDPNLRPGSVLVKDPKSGKTFSFPNQEAADAFKKARGM